MRFNNTTSSVQKKKTKKIKSFKLGILLVNRVRHQLK